MVQNGSQPRDKKRGAAAWLGLLGRASSSEEKRRDLAQTVICLPLSLSLCCSRQFVGSKNQTQSVCLASSSR